MYTFEQIISDLKKKIYKPIYYLMGEEAFFIDSISDYIDKNILQEHIQKAEDLVSRKIRAMVMTSDEFTLYIKSQKEPFLLLWSKE